MSSTVSDTDPTGQDTLSHVAGPPETDSVPLDIDGEAEDEEFVNEDVNMLYRRWRNEKYAPEVLPFDSTTLANIREVIEFVNDGLQEDMELGLAPEAEMDHRLRRMELTRARYVLRDYLRTRLRKLEAYPQHYLQEENIRVLSEAERVHIRDLWKIRHNFFKHRLLAAMPSGKQSLEDRVDFRDMVRRPDANGHVYVRLLKDLPDEEKIDLPQELSVVKQGETIITQFSLVRRFFFQANLDGIMALV
mmetsp:Transcript_41210/g.94787  ORF Transcript_41210/g.94787 Transcript_41210/m.94787 type:complete len:247 (-) Transcript_41210:101-841(-)